MTCSYENCHFECHESHDTCIFHCEKDDWLTPKRKSWRQNKVTEFWQELRNSKTKIKNQYIGFIFPKFEEYDCDLTFKNGHHQTLNYECIDNTNFGIRTKYKQYHACLNPNTSFKNSVFLDNADFSKVSFKNNQVSFEDTNFHKDFLHSTQTLQNINFDNANFKNHLNFSEQSIFSCSFNRTVFSQKAEFTNGTLNQAQFLDATFEDDVSFENVTISGQADFSQASFQKEANFKEGSFGNHANFSEAQFAGDALFTAREFSGDANFSEGVTIKGKACFDVNGIAGNADFSGATFGKAFTFENVAVTGETNFSQASFQKDANFKEGSFNNHANFSEAQFAGDALFSGREFSGDANFSEGVTIKGKACFDVNGIAGNADFSGATFGKAFTFENVAVTGETNFSQASFQKDANFKEGSFDNHANFSEAQFAGDALFSGHKFSGDANFPSTTIRGKAYFDVNGIAGDADFSETMFEDEVIFKDVVVSGKTYFLESVFQNKANFKGGVFEGDANFLKAIFKNNIVFNQGEFRGDLDFKAVKVEGEADFSEVRFSGIVDLCRATFQNFLSFGSCLFEKACKFGNLNSQDIDFGLSKFKGQQSLDLYTFFDFYHSNCGSVNFWRASINFDSFYFTEGNNLKELLLKDINIEKECEFKIKDTNIGYLSFNNYHNKSETVLFDSITVNDRLDVKKVRFVEEQFSHCDISKPVIEIEKSEFNSSFFNTVKWGTISDKRFSASRDIFRQLKSHSEQHKNHIDADGFYSLEMKEQKKELQKEGAKLKSIPEKIQHWFTHTLVFLIHEKTSNFSQNWWLPIFWLIVFGMAGVIYHKVNEINVASLSLSLLFYSVFVLTFLIDRHAEEKKIPKFIFNLLIFAPLAWQYFQVSTDYFDDIAKLLNPINIFKNNNISKPHELVSLLYKIIVLFLVYQVIASVKKKVRSK